ncbi:MAG: hypothetical protein Kow0059_20530 [Candidatus Sumerlaeia bacterium]
MPSRLLIGLGFILSILAFQWMIGAVPAHGDGRPGDSSIAWRTDYEAALAEAKKEGQLIFADFHAAWCGPCKMMDRTTFKNDEVVARLAGYIPLKVDVDAQRNIAMKYGVTATPTLAILNADGSLVGGATGYHDAKALLALLEEITGAKQVGNNPSPNLQSWDDKHSRSASLHGSTSPTESRQLTSPTIAARCSTCSHSSSGAPAATRPVSRR